MMAFAKRDEPEQMLVRMIPGTRPAIRPVSPRAESPPKGPSVEEYVTFYESRRSGNVGISVAPSASSAHEAVAAAERILAAQPCGSSPETQAERSRVEPRIAAASTTADSPRVAGGIPTGRTLHDFRAWSAAERAPTEDEIIGRIMACDCQRPAAAAAISSPTAAMHRPQFDAQLSRIVDAWPGLPSTTREAVVAVLDSPPEAGGRVPSGARTVAAPRRKPSRAKRVSESAETGRRRTPKAASPPS